MNITRHNIFVFGFWLCVGITGAVQALHGQQLVGDIDWIVALLGAAEHYFAGNIS